MNRAEAYIKFLVYAAVIVLINVAGMTLFFRVDLTENNIYSLSKASRQAVSTLSEPMTIKVFFTKDLPAPHNNTRRYLRDLLKEYSLFANEYFNYRFHDVTPKGGGSAGSGQNRQLAREYGIRPVQIRSVEQDEIQFKNAYMGLVLIHGDLIEKIPALTSTDRIEYQLTTAINKLNNKISALAGLEEKIRVKLIMSSSLEAVAPYMGLKQLPELPEQVKKTVEKVNAKNYSRLSYEYRDPAEAKLDGILSRHDIMSLKWPDIADAGIDAGRGAIGLVMQYKDKSRVVELLHATRVPIIGTRYELVDTNRLDELITENMETLIGINQNLGYLASHGSPSLTPRMMQSGGNQQKQLGNLNRHLSENYSIKRINLEKQSIPESLNCLLIAQPTKKFSDYELFQIDQALMRGTNLAIFADAYKKAEKARQQRSFRQPSYAPFDSGLAKLLKHYGLRLRKALVLDKNCYQQNLPDRAGGGQQPVYYAPRIKNKNISKKLDFMKRIKGLITVKNSPLELLEKQVRKQGIKAEKLFASSADSWLAEGELTLNPMFMKPPQKKEKFSSHGLAFLLEGSFQSRFEAGSLPVKKTGKKEEEAAENAGIDLSRIQGGQDFIQSGRPAKIAVIGSSALLEDNLIDRKGRSPNTTFVLNIIDVLNQRSDIASLRSKTQRFNPLAETTAATRSLVKAINVAGLPVLVIVCGLFAWWRRRLRKKRIRMLFES